MRYIFSLTTMTVFFLLWGCGTGKQLTQQKATADSYYQSGDYANALSAFNKIISTYEVNNNQQACAVYTKAGISALKEGKANEAIDYLKKATNTEFVNKNTYYYLASAYKQIDNLSLEIDALANYLEKYPQGDKINAVKTRLFYTYEESDNLDKALSLWAEVKNNNTHDTNLLETYFNINKKLNNTDTCDNVAKQLLGFDDKNIVALNWLGKKYYRKAEDMYHDEIKAYENHKTNKQYRILLKSLETVTANFKKSLTYFKKLYAVEPTSENANYLSRIYGRLSDKKRESYYKKLAE